MSLLVYHTAETFLKKLVGRTDIEDALRKLDKLTQDEVRMVAAQGLKATQCVSNSMKAVEDKVIEGTCVHSTTYPTFILDILIRLGGEKTRDAIQHLVSNLGNLNRS
jgi:hypothetical protein